MQRSALSFVLFFAVITLVVGGTHYYLWSRLIRAPELGPALAIARRLLPGRR